MEEAIKICSNQMLISGKITIFTMAFPIIAALLYWRELNKVLKIFFVYCLVTFTLNCLELLYVYGVNNYTSFFEPWLAITDYRLNFLLIFYQLRNFIILGWLFSLLLKVHGQGQKLWSISLFLSLAAIVAYILEKGWKNYGVFTPTVAAVFLVVVPLLYLWFLVRSSLSVPIMKNPYFLIGIGLAIPNLISLFLFFMGDPLQANHFCLFARLSIAKNCFLTIGQLLFALAFWRAHFTKYIPPTAI